MKTNFLIGVIALLFFASTTHGKDLPKSQVPSLVINSFQQAFPKAFDIDWELDGELYKVDFEIGLLGTHHDVWYDKAGKLVRHKEEISKSDLPQKVLAKIKSDFSGYRIDDVKKITEGNVTSYTLELKRITKEWKMAFDADGNILSQIAD